MNENAKFEKWLAQVNRVMILIAGIGIDDIDDFDYWTAFESNKSFSNTAKKALKNAGW